MALSVSSFFMRDMYEVKYTVAWPPILNDSN